MKTIGDRLKEARQQANMTQQELAAATDGVSQQMISKLESGKSHETAGVLALARALGCDPYWLAEGKGRPESHDGNVSPERRSIVKVPLISSIRAGAMCGSPDLYQPGDAEEWVETTARVSAYSYALRVVGDSMTNPHGSPSIPEGSIVIIDPQAEALPGKIVVVKVKGEDDATLKRFVKDGPQYYLRALNPAYPMIPYDKERYVICGVAKQVIQEL